mmetsp:Transcript_3610/g.5328  ORF Transcript_3610/g.5328 Transcript_3610/m.5328 type:complete len:235 (-) Transcript_3610:82-786(-)
MLRDEVSRSTPLGNEVAQIMARGELVSSAVITTLVRRRMRDHPGARVLLDGFPRSLENAHDFMKQCGTPELALHLQCDDTIMIERILERGRSSSLLGDGHRREDDTLQTALQRLRTFHKYHKPTMDWLREQHVPIVNLDCTGTPENVWNQLLAIGRLMRPVAQHYYYQQEESDHETKIPANSTTGANLLRNLGHEISQPENMNGEKSSLNGSNINNNNNSVPIENDLPFLAFKN